MKARSIIFGLFAAAVLVIALFAAGCGDDATTTAAVQCDPDSPSLIPAPSGKPQLIYFFRDT
jgi:hypothetical protein